jgi:hypothetical protein
MTTQDATKLDFFDAINKVRLKIPLLRSIPVRRLARRAGLQHLFEQNDLPAQLERRHEPIAGRGRRLEFIPQSEAERQKLAKNNYLANYAASVTSQNGEDGVLAEILARLGIKQGWCVEFGAWDGEFHSNTWDLVHNKKWKAVLIEYNAVYFALLQELYKNRPDIYCFNDMVHWEGEKTLDRIFERTPLPHDFDLMIVDIDGNDFYVWQACQKYQPKVVMIEINPLIPSDIYYVHEHGKDINTSSSLRAMCELGKEKGYELICVIGGNAVLVQKQYLPIFAIEDNQAVSMYRAIAELRIFQGYDGSLLLAGERRLIWRHQIDRSGQLRPLEIDDSDIQVLPKDLRVFRPRLSYKNAFLEEHAGRLDRTRVPSNRFLGFQENVTSENGEDGILRQLFNELGVGNGFCVEVGAYDGKTFSNTWTLIHEKGWRGILIEKDANAFPALKAEAAKRPDVQAVQAEVTTQADSDLDSLLTKRNAPAELDFLCIDVEGNDYHLWASLERFRPKVVMIDFNPTVPNDIVFNQEDDPAVNLGASLRALIELGKTKGYELAAVTTWNAIFVRNDLFARLGFADNSIDLMYYPVFEMKIFQSTNTYLTVTGCDRLVRHNYVFDPEQLQPVPPNIRPLAFAVGPPDPNPGMLSTFFGPPR